MSIATTIFHCHTCAFETGDLHTWGSREYVMPSDVRIPMDWTLGWCPDCNDVQAVELLDAERHQLELGYVEADLKAFCASPGGGSVDQIFANWNYLKGIVEDSKDALRVISERTRPLHCLSCGCEQVIPWQTKIDGDMRLIHGPCGEEFEERESGMRFAIFQTMKAYTINGDLIDEAEIPGYSMPDREVFEERKQANAKIRGLWTPTTQTVEISARPWWPQF